jgi:hypothetical protein
MMRTGALFEGENNPRVDLQSGRYARGLYECREEPPIPSDRGTRNHFFIGRTTRPRSSAVR